MHPKQGVKADSDTAATTKDKSATGKKAEDNKTTGNKTTVKKPSSGDRVYMVGSRGGCYYLTESGKKSYVDKKFCENNASTTNSEKTPTGNTDSKKEETKPTTNEPKTQDEEKPKAKSNSDGRTYMKGAKGGCYYINKNGNKTYVDKELCN
jgi:hypothetical protein